jgi:hypothetical protein
VTPWSAQAAEQPADAAPDRLVLATGGTTRRAGRGRGAARTAATHAATGGGTVQDGAEKTHRSTVVARRAHVLAPPGVMCSWDPIPFAGVMAEKKGKGSSTAQKANAKASKEGKKNPRKSSAAQAELGKKGARKNKS